MPPPASSAETPQEDGRMDTREARLLEAARDWLQHGGQHDGPCTNADNKWDSCDLHVAAYDARKRRIAEAVAAYDE